MKVSLLITVVVVLCHYGHAMLKTNKKLMSSDEYAKRRDAENINRADDYHAKKSNGTSNGLERNQGKSGSLAKSLISKHEYEGSLESLKKAQNRMGAKSKGKKEADELIEFRRKLSRYSNVQKCQADCAEDVCPALVANAKKENQMERCRQKICSERLCAKIDNSKCLDSMARENSFKAASHQDCVRTCGCDIGTPPTQPLSGHPTPAATPAPITDLLQDIPESTPPPPPGPLEQVTSGPVVFEGQPEVASKPRSSKGSEKLPFPWGFNEHSESESESDIGKRDLDSSQASSYSPPSNYSYCSGKSNSPYEGFRCKHECYRKCSKSTSPESQCSEECVLIRCSSPNVQNVQECAQTCSKSCAAEVKLIDSKLGLELPMTHDKCLENVDIYSLSFGADFKNDMISDFCTL